MTGKRLFNLKDLTQDISERPGWSVVFGATCAEAAAVCLVDQGHDSPVNLRIDGINPCEIVVS